MTWSPPSIRPAVICLSLKQIKSYLINPSSKRDWHFEKQHVYMRELLCGTNCCKLNLTSFIFLPRIKMKTIKKKGVLTTSTSHHYTATKLTPASCYEQSDVKRTGIHPGCACVCVAGQMVHRHTDWSSGRKPNMAENTLVFRPPVCSGWFVVYQEFVLWPAFPSLSLKAALWPYHMWAAFTQGSHGKLQFYNDRDRNHWLVKKKKNDLILFPNSRHTEANIM